MAQAYKNLSPQLVYQKAVDAYLAGNIEKAEPYFMYLANQSPFISKNSSVYNYLGLIYHSKNKFNQAIKFFRKSLEVNPKNNEARVNLSILLCDLGLYQDAEEIFSALDA